jgi:predicted RNA-binding protein YlqC (UPF0109 family)
MSLQLGNNRLSLLFSGLLVASEANQNVAGFALLRCGELLRVRVNPEDIGRVIGRGGRTANAIRTVIQALSDHKVRVDIMDVRR